MARRDHWTTSGRCGTRSACRWTGTTRPSTSMRLDAWAPGGGVWYSQACCSAGSNEGTSYAGLLEERSEADRVVRAVGDLGASVAPLPTRLLGAEKPLRAFVGHVEPTFDWTLIAGDTGQFLTAPLVDAVYPNLYRSWPVGLAFDDYYRGVSELYGKLEKARRGIDTLVGGAREAATYYRLTATDRESLVILGDPTVVIHRCRVNGCPCPDTAWVIRSRISDAIAGKCPRRSSVSRACDRRPLAGRIACQRRATAAEDGLDAPSVAASPNHGVGLHRLVSRLPGSAAAPSATRSAGGANPPPDRGPRPGP